MARLRGRRGVRNKKIRISTDADEGLQKIDNSSRDLNVEAFDVHQGENLSADASGETVNGSCTQEDAQLIVDFFKSIEVDDDDGGIEMEKEVLTFSFPPSWDDLLLDPSFENPYFVNGAGDKDDNEVKSEDMNGSYGFVDQGIRIRTRTSSSGFNEVLESSGFNVFAQSSASRRIRLQRKHSQSSCIGEDSKNKEFGRDTNRLDYFSVAAFDVNGDDHLTGAAINGGGSGRRDGGIVLAPGPEERGGATDVAGEAVVQRLEQERGDGGDSGGRRGRRLMVGMRLEQERGSATAGAGGGDRTRDIPGGIFGNNGSNGGEVIVKRLKQERATVAVPVVVVQAVAVMMMVMVITMALVMVKKEVWW